MSWNIAESDWSKLKVEIKERWGEITDVHLADVAGRREYLSSLLQDIYEISLEDAEEQIRRFEDYIKELGSKA